MITLALWLIGFSLFSALLLAITHLNPYRQQPPVRLMGLVLLAALSTLQFAHWQLLSLEHTAAVNSWLYRMSLFIVAPAFFLFSQPLLQPNLPPAPRLKVLIHALPLGLAVWLPTASALPLAFVVGAGYLLWLMRRLYALRRERANFQREVLLLGGALSIALVAALLGVLHSAWPERWFFSIYACAIGSALLLVQLTLGLRPQLSNEVREISEVLQAPGYAKSTLNQVDCTTALTRLEQLMQQALYQDPEFNLAALAAQLELSPHQTSELLNTRLGKSFSRYLREQRIQAAQILLCQQPSASVLSIGLSVGFTSQSNFYQAFREIVGMTPGQYRQLQRSSTTE